MRNITKRVLAIGLSLAMCMGISAPFASAINDTPVNVNANIQVREADQDTYKEQITYAITANSMSETFDYKATIDMEPVRQKFIEFKNMAELLAEQAEFELRTEYVTVNGQFVITITAPAGFEIPATMKTGTDLYGFLNADAMRAIYQETVQRVYNSADNSLTITIDVVDKTFEDFGYAEEPEVSIANLFDLALECENVVATNIPATETASLYVMTGAITGYTDIAYSDETSPANGSDFRITYNFIQDEAIEQPLDGENLSATISVRKKSDDGGHTGGGSVPKRVTITAYDINGNVAKTFEGRSPLKADLSQIDTAVEGYTFIGWFYDEAHTNPVTGTTVTATNDTALYPAYKAISGDLNADDHFAYIVGYPDQTVRPSNNISREEVVTIFYRLLTDEKRDSIYSETNNYSDTDANSWSNNAVSTLSNGEYVEGYEDGTFAPEAAITRAEFVTIASRFFNETATTVASYDDVEGHWAADYIAIAEKNMWILGDGNGNFRPDAPITRAEVMAIVNRILNRSVDAEGLVDGYINWIDNPESAWYYYEVIEATTSHNFTRNEGTADPETWTEITENRDWTELEK